MFAKLNIKGQDTRQRATLYSLATILLAAFIGLSCISPHYAHATGSDTSTELLANDSGTDGSDGSDDGSADGSDGSDDGSADGADGSDDGSADGADEEGSIVYVLDGELVETDEGLRCMLLDGTYLVSGWAMWGESVYYFDGEGYAARHSEEIDGKYYYFGSNGVMRTSKWIKWSSDGRKSYFQEDGTAASGFTEIDGETYYFNPDEPFHKALTGNQVIDGDTYYFNSDLTMRTGWKTWSDGRKTYYSKTDGKALTGWQTIGSKTYYFNPNTTTHKALRYSQTIDGNTYYFGSNSVMRTGWIKWKSDGRCSYFGVDGVKRYGVQEVNGTTYDFGTSGKTSVSNFVKVRIVDRGINAQSDTSYCIIVDRSNHRVGVFKGEQGDRQLVKYVKCSTGAPSTPTPTGTFDVGYRGVSFGESKGYSCWYYTQFYRTYLFHSVLYYPYSKSSIQDGRLGYSVSHGCIRLAISNAKYIYNNVPKYSRVIVY